MSSETFTTAMFLIAAIIAAGVLINAVFPVIYSLSGTISSSSHEMDERIRTDVKIVTTYASVSTDTAQIWLKNVGNSRISVSEIDMADVFLGAQGDFDRLSRAVVLSGETWVYEIEDDTNGYWEPGETLHITARTAKMPANSGDIVYFQVVLTTGLSRATEFTASN
jgi:flagellar protein FlaG